MAIEKMPPLEERVAGFVEKHRLAACGERLVVAVSGGADSTCLIHILAGLRERLDITLHIAHLDHGLRGEEGQADADYVLRLAGRLGMPSTIGRADVKAYQKKHRLSLEEAAREVRYRFLSQTATEVGAGRIATGHTRDDQVETILMHLIRGTGTKGLTGLRPESCLRIDGQVITIIRPLLDINRQETDDYCRENKLEPRLDSSNLSLSPLRNRIRQQLIPLLKTYNPDIAAALLRTAANAASELDYLDGEMAGVRANVVGREGEAFTLDKAGFSRLHPALRRHLLRAIIEELPGGLKDIETRHIEDILSMLDRPSGKRINLPHGLAFTIEHDRFVIGRGVDGQSIIPPFSGEYPLNIPGQTRLPGWVVEASVIEKAGAPDGWTTDPDVACLDFDKTGYTLIVRSPRPGDVFQPLGMDSPKKMNRFMIDSRIPHARRAGIPVVLTPGQGNDSPGQIVWLVGYRINGRFKITPETKKILRLEFHAL
jgi:tRNA(Ile)-lysidine synthase